MPDVSAIWKTVETIWMTISGTQGPVPRWLSIVVGIILGIWLFAWLMGQLLELIVKVMEQWEQKIWPHFYNAEQRRHSTRRQRFAQHIRSRLEILNSQEDWKDYHFTELEAEVEAEGRRRFFWFGEHNTLRRERSLSKALEHSGERCILVEGEPGSGKSVALRHVALRMSEKAAHSHSIRSVIPIYINLKELERDAGTPIDRNLIENFVLASLKQANDRDVEQFLDEEFHEGMKNGIWFFLFDSFDEIPEVLSSTDVDEVIKDYSLAISDFLHGMNSCRGIIASRQFRGPRSLSWPRFRVLALSEQRQHELIRKVNMPPRRERAFWEGFAATTQEVRAMASNPLFLSLLCEHMQNDGDFPQTTHSVFEAYIARRFTRDKDRVQQRYQLDVATLRDAAEKIAFCMTADQGIGLNPTRDKIKKALRRARFDLGDKFEATLDALEYIKLARGPAETWQQEKTFTFAHRRFQEYFATCVVLANPRKVTARQLLTDARWRETAVTMCQMQAAEKLQALITEAEQLLEQYCDTLEASLSPLGLDQITDLEAQDDAATGEQADSQTYVTPSENKYETTEDKDEVTTEIQPHVGFLWPKGVLHLLSLLQDGFVDHYEVLPSYLREMAGWLLDRADEVGGTFDRKWALEVAGIAPRDSLGTLLRRAFVSRSQWFKDVAYQQVTHVHTMTPELRRGIGAALMKMYYEQRLWRERYMTTAHLKRLPNGADLLLMMKMLLWLPIIEMSLFALLLVIDWYQLVQQALPPTMFNIIGLSLCSALLIYIIIVLLYLPLSVYKKRNFYIALAIEYPLKAYLAFIFCWQVWQMFLSGFKVSPNGALLFPPLLTILQVYGVITLIILLVFFPMILRDSIQEGNFSSLWRSLFIPVWIVYPFLIIYAMIKGIRDIDWMELACILRSWRKQWTLRRLWQESIAILKTKQGKYGIIVGLLALIIGGIPGLMSNEWYTYSIELQVAITVIWIAAVLFVLLVMLGFLLYLLVAPLYLVVTRQSLYQNVLQKKQISVYDFFKTSAEFGWSGLRIQFIKAVREGNLLVPSMTTVSTFTDILLCLEEFQEAEWEPRRERKQKQKMLLDEMRQKTAIKDENDMKALIDPEVMDEFYKLLEQMRSSV